MCAAEVTGPGVPGRTVVSVIGPDRAQATAVAEALGHRVPGRRFVVGAGPGDADGVIAVTGAVPGPRGSGTGDGGQDGTGTDHGARDTAVVRAVRDATGGCVLYTAGPGLPTDEPGVTVVRWSGGPEALTAPENLDRLVDVVRSLWVDVPRWLSDIRRADADRIDRVRVAVRLCAERDAADLLDPASGGPGPGVPDGRRHLTALFHARLRCAVLEQGVEWPRVPGPDPAEVGDPGPGADDGDRSRVLLLVAASLGAGLAAALGVTRLAGPVAGGAAGLVVALVLGLVRWRMLVTARRERDRARWAVRLRREWSAVATEVVARLRVPAVADALLRELRQEASR